MANDTAGAYAAIVELLHEVSKAQDAGAQLAALALIYVGIDTMAWLKLPVGRCAQNRRHFMAWVIRYLTAGSEQSYQYSGRDLYAARCALLHSYSSVSVVA